MVLDAPDRLLAAHLDFLAAGAEVISAATYQLSLPGLRARGFDQRGARETFERAVAVAKRAVVQHGGDATVAASIGSYGAHRCDGSEYRGDFGVAAPELERFHAVTLGWAGTADLVLFETVPSADEVRSITALLAGHRGRAALSVVVRDAQHLADGTPLADLLTTIDAAQLLFFGVNCVAPELALGAGRYLRRAGLETPLALYPNRGHRYEAGKGWARPAVAPVDFPDFVEQAAELGAAYVGGCCQIGPDDIAAARARLEARAVRLDARDPPNNA